MTAMMIRKRHHHQNAKTMHSHLLIVLHVILQFGKKSSKSCISLAFKMKALMHKPLRYSIWVVCQNSLLEPNTHTITEQEFKVMILIRNAEATSWTEKSDFSHRVTFIVSLLDSLHLFGILGDSFKMRVIGIILTTELRFLLVHLDSFSIEVEVSWSTLLWLGWSESFGLRENDNEYIEGNTA